MNLAADKEFHLTCPFSANSIMYSLKFMGMTKTDATSCRSVSMLTHEDELLEPGCYYNVDLRTAD